MKKMILNWGFKVQSLVAMLVLEVWLRTGIHWDPIKKSWETFRMKNSHVECLKLRNTFTASTRL